MSNLGTIRASLASASQETTLALANLNFDFSLVKVEAPLEYQGVGKSLSPFRRTAAEDGTLHVVARRLGLLFSTIIPKTPNLIKAYGQRASDISASIQANVKSGKAYGPFKDFVGVDATSIWAAATSGSGAIAVHLLACMLARFWPQASESLAIWLELVSERKRQLAGDTTAEYTRLEDMVAAQLDVNRDQLSRWDASARAWLSAADVSPVIFKHQKQVMLILDNISKPVNNSTSVYESICQAWTTALITMDRIVGGASYSIKDGVILLALSAWHIYPDLVIVGQHTQQVNQNDALVSTGGIVTIGWEGIELDNRTGVYWSLYLAHVRYYGPPVMAKENLTSFSDRLTIDELMQVALGSLFGCCRVRHNRLREAVGLIHEIGLFVERQSSRRVQAPHEGVSPSQSWLKLLTTTAQTLQEHIADSDIRGWKLLNFGYRHPSFLARGDHSKFFGQLTRFSDLQTCISRSITYLRKIAIDLGATAGRFVLRIFVNYTERIRSTNYKNFVYLTVLPIVIDTNAPKKSVHVLWSHPGSTSDMEFNDIFKDCHRVRLDHSMVNDSDSFSFMSHGDFFASVPPVKLAEHIKVQAERKKFRWSLRGKRAETSLHEHTKMEHEIFRHVMGDPNDVALFAQSGTDEKHPKLVVDELYQAIGLSKLRDLLYEGVVETDVLLRHFAFPSCRKGKSLLLSLRTLPTIYDLYKDYPGATVSPLIITSSKSIGAVFRTDSGRLASGFLDSASNKYHFSNVDGSMDTLDDIERDFLDEVDPEKPYWDSIRSSQKAYIDPFSPHRISRATAFACIATMESGIQNLHEYHFKNVMAISVGAFLYIAAPLLTDPSTVSVDHKIHRVTGNIGRPGLALLIPPANPQVKQHDGSDWKMVNHSIFDGRLENSFKETFLHLKFSGYEAPINTGRHGNRYVESYYVETVVSVHDCGKWVADLDVLNSLARPGRIHQLSDSSRWVHQVIDCHSDHSWQVAKQTMPLDLVTVDNWDELLDPPSGPAVIKTHGNWQARLAAVCIGITLGHTMMLFKEEDCWHCGNELLKTLPAEIKEDERESLDGSGYANKHQSLREKHPILVL